MIAASSLSHADVGNGGFFIDGSVGRTRLNKNFDGNFYFNDTSDTGYVVNAGYRWALNPSIAIGIEGGYARIGHFDPNGSVDFILRPAELSGLNVGVNAHINISPRWYASVRGGYFRGDVKGSYIVSVQLPQIDVDGTSDKYYAGAGVGYNFAENMSIGLNFDRYRADLGKLNFSPYQTSISAEYRF